MRSRYIVVDGLDGCGKGTQLEFLKARFASLGIGNKILFIREPGSTKVAESIRNLLLSCSEITSFTELLLFFASRAELMQHVVIPALKSGNAIISDRGDSSTLAFQLYARQRFELLPAFKCLRSEVFNSPAFRSGGPDLYIFLDLAPEEAFRRMNHDTARVQTHFDRQGMEFHSRVRRGFQEFANHSGKSRIVTIDASRSPEAIHEDVWNVLREELGID